LVFVGVLRDGARLVVWAVAGERVIHPNGPPPMDAADAAYYMGRSEGLVLDLLALRRRAARSPALRHG
jgi:hypothetical protein